MNPSLLLRTVFALLLTTLTACTSTPVVTDIEKSPVDKTATAIEKKLTKMTHIADNPGSEIWLQHAEHYDNGKGFMQWVFNSDMGMASNRDFVLGCIINSLFAEKATAIIERANNLGIDITIDRTQDNMQRLTLSGISEKQTTLAEELLKQFIDLTFSEEEFLQHMEKFRQWIAGEALDAPSTQAFRAAQRATAPLDWSNRKILMISQTVNVNQVRDYHQALLRTSFLRVYAFGHYQPNSLVKLLSAVESQIDERDPDELYIAETQIPESGEVLNLKSSVEHADVALLDLRLYPQASLQKQAAYSLLGTLMNNVAQDQLRTEKQLGHLVDSANDTYGEIPSLGLVVQSSDNDLEQINARLSAFLQDFSDLLADTSDESIHQLREDSVQQLTQKPENFEAEAHRQLDDFYLNNTAFDSHDKLIAAYKALNKEALVEAYREWLTEASPRMLIQVRGDNFGDSDFAEP